MDLSGKQKISVTYADQKFDVISFSSIVFVFWITIGFSILNKVKFLWIAFRINETNVGRW